MPIVGHILASWDELDILQAHVESLKESGEHEGKSDQELFRLACEDPDLMSFEWEWLCGYLTELMARNPHGGWKAQVANFGWRSLNGEKTFRATNGRELLRQVLPKTDCTFKVFKYGWGLAINNAHHDSPTWSEWYYISPCKEAA